ncbi:hypothetical protein C8R45DRAFT_751223, partial [Mycena sanguinolenta]
TFKLDVSPELRKRGIHPAFHSSLLRPHAPNDDRRFPGRTVSQITGIGDITEEWAVDKILGHAGRGRQAIFLVLWKHGDTAWFPYKDVSHLKSLAAYFEAYGVHSIEKL